MLAHPEAIDLVVEAHPLGLVAERASLDEKLLDFIVPVEREGLAKEPAEESVRVGVVGPEACYPEVLVGESVVRGRLSGASEFVLPEMMELKITSGDGTTFAPVLMAG